jgi:hypothetical protein
VAYTYIKIRTTKKKKNKWCFLGEDSGGHTRPIAITGRDNNQTNGVGLVTNCCFLTSQSASGYLVGTNRRSVICSEIIDAIAMRQERNTPTTHAAIMPASARTSHGYFSANLAC